MTIHLKDVKCILTKHKVTLHDLHAQFGKNQVLIKDIFV